MVEVIRAVEEQGRGRRLRESAKARKVATVKPMKGEGDV